MSKRFTDTDKWTDPWFDELENDEKLMWLYICDKCTIAGIWKINFKIMRYHCNTTKSDEAIKELFKNRFVEFTPGKWFLPKFLLFQYPKGLSSDKPAIAAVRQELLLNNLSSLVIKLFGNDYLIIKDKDKDKIKTIQRQRQAGLKRIFEENYNDPKYIPRPND